MAGLWSGAQPGPLRQLEAVIECTTVFHFMLFNRFALGGKAATAAASACTPEARTYNSAEKVAGQSSTLAAINIHHCVVVAFLATYPPSSFAKVAREANKWAFRAD